MYLNNWGLNIFGKKKKKVIEESEEDIAVSPLPENSRILDEYWVYEPYAKIVIAEEKAGKRKYYVIEERLDVEERVLFEKLLSFMERELDPPTENVDREKYVISAAESLMNRYKRLKPASEESKGKILYYVVRELVGFSHIHPIMLDPNIEDISCNGINMPIYVYHRYYESLPTNIVFLKEDVLDDFIIRLAHQAGKHISSAHPILDATLPGKHRLAATFMREVSNFGSTFCIRKFRENPFSITELISMGTINKEMAAYLWILVENKMSIMVLGGTGAGKTTMLNAILSLIRPEVKIVTVEETAEMNISHENWVPFISREEFGFTGTRATSVTLFDLVKTSLRYRPDYLIVGEIRGEEAYVLFQALATGHGGMSTMHADSLDYAIKRLTSPPMNISTIYLPLMNAWLHMERTTTSIKGAHKAVRRVRTIWELDENGKYRVMARWLPDKDVFQTFFEKSILLEKISKKTGLTFDDVLSEMRRRAEYLESLIERRVMSHREVSAAIRAYYMGKVKPIEVSLHDGDGGDGA